MADHSPVIDALHCERLLSRLADTAEQVRSERLHMLVAGVSQASVMHHDTLMQAYSEQVAELVRASVAH
jgi:hypothetical protein